MKAATPSALSTLPPPDEAPEAVVVDLSAQSPDPPPALLRGGKPRYLADAHGRVVRRDPETVDALCLHQTACRFGPFADAEKRHARALGVPIHALAFRDGTVVLPYLVDYYLWHGNGWNARSLGLEVEGHFAGVEADPRTRALAPLRGSSVDGADGLDDVALAAARRAVYELVARGRAAGMPIRYLVAHRQSSEDRRGDPGELVYRRVGLEYAVAELGLEPLSAAHVGSGRPVPVEWDPTRGVGTY